MFFFRHCPTGLVTPPSPSKVRLVLFSPDVKTMCYFKLQNYVMMMMMEMTIVIIIKLFLICWPKSMYANNMTDFEVKILGIVKERPKLSGKAPLPPFSRCPKENLYPRGRSTLIDYHFRQLKKMIRLPQTLQVVSAPPPNWRRVLGGHLYTT